MTQVLPRTRVKRIQIIPGRGTRDALGCRGYWACQVVKFLSDAIPLIYPQKATALWSVYHGKVSRTHHKIICNFSVITRGWSAQGTTSVFWRSQRHVLKMGTITASQTPPCTLPKPSQRQRACGVPQMMPKDPLMCVGDGSDLRSTWLTSAPEQHTQHLAAVSSQRHRSSPHNSPSINSIHFSQVEAVASSKPPWRKGIKETTFKPKRLRDPGWNKLLCAEFPQLSLGLEHFSCQSTHEGYQENLKWARGCQETLQTQHKHRASPLPQDSWDCSGESIRQVWESHLCLQWVQLPSQNPCQRMRRTATSSSLSCQLHVQCRWDGDPWLLQQTGHYNLF